MLSASTFDVSLTLHDYADISSTGDPPKVTEESLSNATVSVLTSWTAEDDIQASAGVAVGCQDGTLYLWKAIRSDIPRDPSRSTLSASFSGGTSPPAVSRASISTSRSGSPSGGSGYASPFPVNQRSRIVSGITTEQVEAPKNYVDFDEEPDKLKDILKGRAPKDKDKMLSPVDDLSPTDANREASKRKERSRSLRSPPASPLLAPRIVSTPASPKAVKYDRSVKSGLELFAHVLLPSRGSEAPVTSIHAIRGGNLLAVLQSSGHLTILTTVDGRCATALNVDDTKLHPPSGTKGGCGTHDVWRWDRIQVLFDGERTFILAAASRDPKSSFSQTFDAQDDDAYNQCKVVLVELTISQLAGNVETGLKSIGQWCVESTPDAVGLYYAPDRPFIFYYITAAGQFFTRELNISSQAIYPKTSRPQTPDSHSINMTLPNPFKVAKAQPADDSDFGKEDDYGRVALEEPREAGLIPVDEKNVVYSMSIVDGSIYGMAWSEKELMTFRYQDGSLNILFNFLAKDIQSARFFDKDTFILVSPERTELHKVECVDANNDRVLDSALTQKIFQPNIVHTTVTGSCDAIDAVSAGLLVVLQKDDGHRQLKHFRWDKNG
ncbi:hypothetical protein MPER_11126, partial [Moniliophthora perniciosa FA553]